MEESTADALVNRDGPIPVIKITANEGGGSSDSERKRDRLKKSLSSSKLKEKIRDVGAGAINKTGSGSSSLQDRLFTK